MRTPSIPAIALLLAGPALADPPPPAVPVPDLPDPLIVEAYERAARLNVLAAVNPTIFPGYFSVCADGEGFGRGNSYPSLDGHQMSDALLWLGEVSVVRANWKYVRSFQREDGLLPLAIIPGLAGKKIGSGANQAPVAANGGLYQHWVPGNPLGALAGPTYIQNADVLFRRTQDREWLAAQLPSVNLAAEYLASLTDDQGRVRGAGYYVERPSRIDSDGVAQCHAVDAFRRAAALNRAAGGEAKTGRYEELAARIERHFRARFWVKDHFAEYIHPERGLVASHGLTDVDWAAVAFGVATPVQEGVLWPQLKDEARFHYGGMPTAISTRPETYEAWEFPLPDRHDLAAMGRVWYVEAQARARMGDAEGLLRGIRKVCEAGREGGYYWRERYHPDGKGGRVPAGAEKYCEYPANLIRIVQRFLLGVDLRLDGTLALAPTVTAEFWERGFGQTLAWRDRTLRYRMEGRRIEGMYAGGGPQRLAVRPSPGGEGLAYRATVDARPAAVERDGAFAIIALPASPAEKPSRFEVTWEKAGK